MGIRSLAEHDVHRAHVRADGASVWRFDRNVESLFRVGFFSNPGLLGAVALTVGLQFAILYLPPLRSVFRTEPLGAADLVIVATAAAAVFAAIEIEKWIRRALTA